MLQQQIYSCFNDKMPGIPNTVIRSTAMIVVGPETVVENCSGGDDIFWQNLCTCIPQSYENMRRMHKHPHYDV
jgi:hypothetical protein